MDRARPQLAFLLLSIVAAAVLATYIGTERLAEALRRRTVIAVVAAVALATLTPFCSCGTMAVVLGALAARVPWAPVVAFMVASPLTSPEEYALSIGLFGQRFATTYFVAAVVLGLVAGAVTYLIERTGWLAGQARLAAPALIVACSAATAPSTASACQASPEPAGSGPAGANTNTTVTRVATDLAPASLRTRWKLDAFGHELVVTARKLALYFLGFATIGYLLIELIPTGWLVDYLGNGSVWAVPLTALLGIPAYLNTEGSLPLVAAFMRGGMGAGPALAFLVTGAGTSLGAISGMLLIARTRVVTLVVGLLFTGAVLLGWLAPLWL